MTETVGERSRQEGGMVIGVSDGFALLQQHSEKERVLFID